MSGRPGSARIPRPVSVPQRKPVRRVVAAALLALLLAGAAAPARADDDEPALTIGPPTVQDGLLRFELEVSRLFAGDAVEALQSGLPATVVVRWSLWRLRSGWWDEEVVSGSTFFRIYYDVLEQRYDLFDRSGRPLAGSDRLEEIETALCRRRGLSTVLVANLDPKASYVLEVLARLEPLDEEQIDQLEAWARGERESDKPFLSALSRRAVGWLKKRVGPEARTAWSRSEPFRLDGR